MEQIFSTFENLSIDIVSFIILFCSAVVILAISMILLTAVGNILRIFVPKIKKFRGLTNMYNSMDSDYIRLAKKLRISDTAGRYMSLMATPILTLFVCLAMCMLDRKHMNRG